RAVSTVCAILAINARRTVFPIGPVLAVHAVDAVFAGRAILAGLALFRLAVFQSFDAPSLVGQRISQRANGAGYIVMDFAHKFRNIKHESKSPGLVSIATPWPYQSGLALARDRVVG